MSELQREDRYIVIKRSDILKLGMFRKNDVLSHLATMQKKFDASQVPMTRECVVVESDWPEFELVWRMIEARVTGNPIPDYDALAAQFDALAESVGFSQSRCEQTGDSPLDCAQQLAAQRDEGLAREAELRKERDNWHGVAIDFSLRREELKAEIDLFQGKCAVLQQRLAEAETLLRSLESSWNDHSGRARHSETMNEVEDYLASPGCADGDKS